MSQSQLLVASPRSGQLSMPGCRSSDWRTECDRSNRSGESGAGPLTLSVWNVSRRVSWPGWPRGFSALLRSEMNVFVLRRATDAGVVVN